MLSKQVYSVYQGKGKPFPCFKCHQASHCFPTGKIVNEEDPSPMLNIIYSGHIKYIQFREEQFITIKEKFSDPIKKYMLLSFNEKEHPIKINVINIKLAIRDQENIQ